MFNVFKKFAIVFMILVMFVFSGCAKGTGINGTTFGDGKIDLVETSVIKLSVAKALTDKPVLAEPAYEVSTALLANLDADQLVIPEKLDLVLTDQITKLGVDDETKQEMIELATIVKGLIITDLSANPNTASKLILIRQVLQMVNTISANKVKKPVYQTQLT